MPKQKPNLNTIYISERLHESLKPISHCTLTTVIAPMGYGKTTAINWYLAERTKREELCVIRSQSDIRNPLSLLAHNRITAPQFIRRGLYPS